MGYLNKDNDTKEVFTEDNWLTLSDLGYMDEDKFLSVVGRMEDFVTLKSEEVISPIRVIMINCCINQNEIFFNHFLSRLSNWFDWNFPVLSR